MEPLINSKEVTDILMDCLFKPEEIEDGKPKAGLEPVLVRGVMLNLGLHPERVEKHKARIGEIISNLPDPFINGGGWTFLNMCNDKNDTLWTGVHKVMDELVVLAIATKQGRLLMNGIPMFGGVPYVEFKPGGFEPDQLRDENESAIKKIFEEAAAEDARSNT